MPQEHSYSELSTQLSAEGIKIILMPGPTPRNSDSSDMGHCLQKLLM